MQNWPVPERVEKIFDERLKTCAHQIVERRRQRDTLDAELNELERSVTQRRSRLGPSRWGQPDGFGGERPQWPGRSV